MANAKGIGLRSSSRHLSVASIGYGDVQQFRTEQPASDVPRTLVPRTVKLWLVMADLVSICVGLVVAFGIQAGFDDVGAGTADAQRVLALGSVPLMFAAACMSNMYTARANSRFQHELRNIFRTVALGVGAMIGLAFILRLHDVSRFWVAAVFGSVTVVLAVERRVAQQVFLRLRRSGRMSRRVLVVGSHENDFGLARTLLRRLDLGYCVVGFVDDVDVDPHIEVPLLGRPDRIVEIAAEHNVSGVIISLLSVSGQTVNLLTRRLTDAGLHVTLCTGLEDIDAHRLRVQDLDGRSMIYIEPTIRTGWRRLAKRIFDVGVAVVGLLLAAPLLLLAAIAIRLESPGPILFRQDRIGMDGQRFRILKLRTMVAGAEALRGKLLDQNESDGPLFKMRDDPRITKVGRVLRKTSIDELPQFWNVLRRDMSVVGPRPALPSEVDSWAPEVHERLRVLPGITGMWQVSGRANATFSEYKRLDLYYVDNWSLAHDLRIVLKTFMAVVNARGAS